VLLRIYENDLEKLYRIKLRKGKSPKLARYEVEQMRKLIKTHGKNTRGKMFKYGKDAFMDFDEDGIMNAFDCRPLNFDFQDDKYFFDHEDISAAEKGSYTKVTKYMAVDEFMELSKETSPFGLDEYSSVEEYWKNVIDEPKTDKYAEAFKKIKKKEQRFPTPFLIKRGDRFVEHSGRHRAVAFSKAFGKKKKFPVYIVTDKGYQ
jgi:hypothetical protein